MRRLFKVLSGNMMDDIQRDNLESVAKGFPTPAQAMQHCANNSGWTYRQLSSRMGVLSYTGIEIALYYQRQVIQISPDPEGLDFVPPAKALKSEDEAWIRVPLLEAKSSLKQSQFFSREYEQMQKERDSLRKLTQTQRTEIDQLIERNFSLERQAEKVK